MERSRKAQTEQWVEDVVYGFFERQMQTRTPLTSQEVTGIIPYLLMHQNMQLAELIAQMDSLWKLLYDGTASMQVNVKESSKKLEGKP